MQGWQEQSFVQDCERLIVKRNGRAPERWFFDSEEEATARRLFIEEAFEWVGTPFRDCGDIRGPKGAVDCAMLLVRCAVVAGLIDKDFDPRPYSPRWHVHRGEEKFIDFLVALGCRELSPPRSGGVARPAAPRAQRGESAEGGDAPRIGDILVWRFGRCYGHGAILVNREEVVHAYGAARMCIVSRLDEPLLRSISFRGQDYERPVRYFDVWSARKSA
jgi:hypothetical protein